MSHLKDLEIKNFRGLEELKLDKNKQINLLVGENNTGKTSILEAICMLEYPLEIGHHIGVSRKRDKMLSPYESFFNMFSKFNSSENKLSLTANINKLNPFDNLLIQLTIEASEESVISTEEYDSMKKINSDDYPIHPIFQDTEFNEEEISILRGVCKLVKNHKKNCESKFSFSEKQQVFKTKSTNSITELSIEYINPIDHFTHFHSGKYIEEAIKEGNKNEIIEILKTFDSDIKGFEMLTSKSRKVIPYIDHKETGLMPISVYGDGLRKALNIAAAVLVSKNGILLIDEIETAIHTKALKEIFSWFLKACKKYNVQVFATTHSLEAIDAIIDSCPDGNLDDINVYRLERFKGRLHSRRIHGEKLWNIRHNLGQDVR